MFFNSNGLPFCKHFALTQRLMFYFRLSFFFLSSLECQMHIHHAYMLPTHIDAPAHIGGP